MGGVEHHVPASAASVTALLERELSEFADGRVANHIGSLLITPRWEMRGWDYGQPGDEFPCWLVLEHPASNTAIAYCEHGFGPTMPWGLLSLSGATHMSMGMDSGWFECFLETYFASKASTEMPIWQVLKHRGIDYPGLMVTPEGSWDETWAEVMRLRASNDGFRYDCGQSVYRRDAQHCA
jgi:hypothetical protein